MVPGDNAAGVHIPIDEELWLGLLLFFDQLLCYLFGVELVLNFIWQSKGHLVIHGVDVLDPAAGLVTVDCVVFGEFIIEVAVFELDATFFLDVSELLHRLTCR